MLEKIYAAFIIYIELCFYVKDYDEINGRDEFHFKSSFSTGLDIKDNILSLISPYRQIATDWSS